MQYQWFPGHMTKAMRMMKENLSLVDLIVELADARIPVSARNPELKHLGKNKIRLVVLNKADLADKNVNAAWKEAFLKEGIPSLLLNSKDAAGAKKLRAAIDEVMQEKKSKEIARGIVGRPVRAMIVGIPNVGKSTLINSLHGHASAKTGNRPGVTKGKQWITLSDGLQLLDTPGVLWPKFEDETTGRHLAMIGSMNDANIDISDLSLQLVVELLPYYKELLASKYAITPEQVSAEKVDALRDSLLTPDPKVYEALPYLYAIAQNRNLLRKGAQPDTERAAAMLLDDFRNGRLGRISIERP
ncbi:MAG: ribosome biogenesis GTPase YlqF [Lachnospiraceae bacterium]|nr:ribosome biogenesis GTPase YlqF [Lachnospiraceae bacterium]